MGLGDGGFRSNVQLVDGFLFKFHNANDDTDTPTAGIKWDGTYVGKAVGGVYDVTNPTYGAVGDGVTNDSAAITAAIAAASADGGVVYLPPGTYGYSSTATVLSNVIVRGAGMGVTILKRLSGGSTALTGSTVNDVIVEDLTIDHNGDVASFSGGISFSDCDNVIVQRVGTIDSNAESTSASIGTGNGVTTTFTKVYTGNPSDRMTIPGTVTVTAGAVVASDAVTNVDTQDSGHEGTLYGTGVSTGLVEYGDNSGNWAVSVTFSSAPASGTDIVLAWKRCDQRQPILILNCSRVTVRDCRLTAGGRIKVGRPGNRCIIDGNILYGVNDNGITVVMTGAHYSTDLIIRNNIVFFAATTGIFVGADGASQNNASMYAYRMRVEDNIVVGNCMNGISAFAPRGASESIQINRNVIKRIGTTSTAFDADRVGILCTNVTSASATTPVDYSIKDNIIIGAFGDCGIKLADVNQFIATGNIFDGLTAGEAFEIGTVTEGIIADNVVNNTFLFINMPNAGGAVTDLTIARNVVEATITSSNSHIIDLDQATSLTRLRIFDNVIKGANAAGNRYVLGLDTLTDVDLYFCGNDWSEESTVLGIRLVNGATLATTSRLWGNRGNGTYGTTWVVPTGTEIRWGSVTGAGFSLLEGSATWDPGDLADGAGETSSSITVTGAALSDYVVASAPYDLQGITANAYVDATNSVKIRLQNETGGNVNLASGTWRVMVFAR